MSNPDCHLHHSFSYSCKLLLCLHFSKLFILWKMWCFSNLLNVGCFLPLCQSATAAKCTSAMIAKNVRSLYLITGQSSGTWVISQFLFMLLIISCSYCAYLIKYPVDNTFILWRCILHHSPFHCFDIIMDLILPTSAVAIYWQNVLYNTWIFFCFKLPFKSC